MDPKNMAAFDGAAADYAASAGSVVTAGIKQKVEHFLAELALEPGVDAFLRGAVAAGSAASGGVNPVLPAIVAVLGTGAIDWAEKKAAQIAAEPE